jgi:hypothetical protein
VGGNALRHLRPVRLSSAQVIDLVHHLHRNWQLVDRRSLYLVPWVAEKTDHGDIDLVCEAEPETVLRFCSLIGADPAAAVCNDTVLSVPMPLPWAPDDPRPVAQVDFICCAPAEAPAMRFFYAGGDFGMLLGRVAAWHGLVFGMDGLRYRADRDCHWQQDVLLTDQPVEVLTALGYPPALPWFDSYDRMWRFVLSSPMAGAWMFVPAATNSENRSRDRQRRKVGDFQDWLAASFPDQLQPPAPRATPAQAQAWVQARFPHLNLDAALTRQQAVFAYNKLRTHLLGLDAAESVLGPGHPPEMLGGLVRAMQALLPPKADRESALTDPARWADMIRLARTAAMVVAVQRGLPVRMPGEPPPFVPTP